MTDTVKKETPHWDRPKMILRCHGYLCRELLGEGAFSRVYRVENRADNKTYACKTSENIKMLRREAMILAELEHALFPEYHDFWESGETGFLVREYIPGKSLEEILRRRDFLSPAEIIRMGTELAEGLSYLHNTEKHLLFRDIKPANIILRQDGRVKLIDFGCVCTSGDSAASRAGSAGFAAPEQLRGGCMLTPACDVYGLGQTLRAAWGRKERKTLRHNRIREKTGDIFGKTFKRNQTERQLARILDMCTEENAKRRIQDMESLRLALKDLMIPP